MQHITGIKINAGLSLPSLCSWFPWGWQGPPTTEGGLTGPPSVSAFHMLATDPPSEELRPDNRSNPFQLGGSRKPSCTQPLFQLKGLPVLVSAAVLFCCALTLESSKTFTLAIRLPHVSCTLLNVTIGCADPF